MAADAAGGGGGDDAMTLDTRTSTELLRLASDGDVPAARRARAEARGPPRSSRVVVSLCSARSIPFRCRARGLSSGRRRASARAARVASLFIVSPVHFRSAAAAPELSVGRERFVRVAGLAAAAVAWGDGPLVSSLAASHRLLPGATTSPCLSRAAAARRRRSSTSGGSASGSRPSSNSPSSRRRRSPRSRATRARRSRARRSPRSCSTSGSPAPPPRPAARSRPRLGETQCSAPVQALVRRWGGAGREGAGGTGATAAHGDGVRQCAAAPCV